MRRILYLVIGLMLGLAASGGVAVAVGGGGTVAGAATGQELLAQAPNARLAVFIRGSNTPGDFEVLRAVGVVVVSNPAAGRFCIKPAAGIKPAYVVPNVSTEYTYTMGLDDFAQWSSARTDCPSGNIQVNTFDISDGGAFNRVAFTVTVD